MNPVIMLDELDKVGSDSRGPGSARGARPRAKYGFRSLHQPAFDLSQVLFLVTTAPLLDRLEMTASQGIRRTRSCRSASATSSSASASKRLSDEEIHFSNPALKALIQGYTREAGVRARAPGRHRLP